MYRNVLRLLLLPRFRFLVIALLFDFFPLNQIDQDIHTKYTLSSDAELILIRSLTLGKVTSKSSHYAQIIAEKTLGSSRCCAFGRTVPRDHYFVILHLATQK